jgi:hypothetical protein
VSTISVDYDVLNQKGSPAWFSDTFANIPTFGYKGRMFISIDTFAFYRDTGTGWDLIGGPGIGTLTGSGTTGQVSFFNGTQVLTGNNNLFWDNTNSRLGINTATPGQALDVHSTANTLVQLNNTTTADSIIAFQNQNVTKWKIGNVYSAGANSFDITNPNLAITPFTISSAGAITLASNVTTTGAQLVQNGLYVSNANAGAQALYTTIFGRNDGINFGLRNSTGGAGFIFQSANSYDYTFPATAGTLALTSNLSSYLPLAGGTLTGALIGTSATFTGDLTIDTNTLFVDSTNNRIGIGTTSPTNKLTISNDGNAAIALRINDTNANASFLSLSASNSDAAIIANGTSAIPLDIYTGGVVRLSIASSGDITLNGSAAAAKLTLGYNFFILNDQSPEIVSFVASSGSSIFRWMQNTTTEVMRISSGGNVLIGQTNNLYNHKFISNGGTYQGISAQTDTTGNDCVSIWNKATSGNNSFTGFYVNSSILGVGSITYNRAAGLTQYNTTSDYRLKSEITDFNALDIVLNLKPKEFRIRDAENKAIGFIAHELKEYFPQAVMGEKDELKEDGSPKYQMVDYSQLTGLLTKAIQELNEKLVRNNIN